VTSHTAQTNHLQSNLKVAIGREVLRRHGTVAYHNETVLKLLKTIFVKECFHSGMQFVFDFGGVCDRVRNPVRDRDTGSAFRLLQCSERYRASENCYTSENNCTV
jgi:hypothetical protein